MKVLYVMGHGGSGSTLLGNVLGELDGFFHAGELRTLWRVGLRGLRECGCHRLVSECPLWAAIVRQGFGGAYDRGQNIDRVGALIVAHSRLRHAIRVLRMNPNGPSGWDALDEYIPILQRLYSAISEVTGNQVIVDTSKRVVDAAILRLLPDIDLSLVHLVRDPRAVAYSWRRDRGEPVLRTARSWMVFNAAGTVVRRRLAGPSRVLRYEDFLARPREAIDSLTDVVGVEPGSHPFVDDRTVQLSENHTISGHVSRLRSGVTELRENRDWLRLLPSTDRRLITLTTFPLLLGYGYPLRLR